MKIETLCFIIIGFLGCLSCTQPENNIPVPKVVFNDSVDASYVQVSISCTVSGNVTADRVIVNYSTDESLSSLKRATAQKQGDTFTATIAGLEMQTTYYYRYTIENSITSYTDNIIRQFTTLEYKGPSVTTVGEKDITGTSAVLEGHLDFTIGERVVEQGFRIGKDKNNLETKRIGLDTFSLSVEDLEYDTRYFYQAYAISEIGTGEGAILEFTTLNGIPELVTYDVADITSSTAVLRGEIKTDGGSNITELGFCYTDKDAPTNESNRVIIESTTGSFSKGVSNLSPVTKYYVRAYAINGTGTHYGNEITFTTSSILVESVTLDKSEITMTEGESTNLTATVKPDNATDKTVTWSSSNTNVATVKNGVVTAVSQGTATITAKAGSYSDTCSVTVQQNVISVTSITLNKTSLTLKEGESESLTATVYPSNATDKTVTWSSSKTSVATVKNGVVTAVSQGTATITAKAGNCSATCVVTVQVGEIAVTGISLNITSLKLFEGETATLIATVSPSNATHNTVTWGSENPNIASVDQSGTVRALKKGVTFIWAKAGEKGALCNVTVEAPFADGPVDMGGSVLWASCNIGADSVEESGEYFAWGETEAKTDYSWQTYKYCNGSQTSLTKYNSNNKYGVVDNKTVLDPDDDVANKRLGGDWHMPTSAEFHELLDNCYLTNITYKGVKGMKLYSLITHNSIFLPLTGYPNTSGYSYYGDGYYWTSSLTSNPASAWYVHFDSWGSSQTSNANRCTGYLIRPVRNK